MFEVEVDKDFGKENWLEFIRDMLKDLVLKDNSGVFLISEAQIVDERFLEDINNLLNIGEIPNLYPPEDKVIITTISFYHLRLIQFCPFTSLPLRIIY